MVSLGVNDYSKTLSSGGATNAGTLIRAKISQMLTRTEELLGKYWEVKPASSFVDLEAFRALSLGKVKEGLYAPQPGATELPSFTDDRTAIIKSELKLETAAALCKTLQVDMVVVIYSEWAVATGGFVPTSKALTKNCVAMYDRSGKQLFFARQDVQGKKTLGAFARIALNDETISQWTDAHSEGIEKILSAKQGKVH